MDRSGKLMTLLADLRETFVKDMGYVGCILAPSSIYSMARSP